VGIATKNIYPGLLYRLSMLGSNATINLPIEHKNNLKNGLAANRPQNITF